eukprot:GHVU01120084.1.p1 GENE.GHVU01120084.1~~GHVU01120084.1.p1  ORF type:complete len:305 (+),score=4.39 GHVU01120084.1:82-915(+)
MSYGIEPRLAFDHEVPLVQRVPFIKSGYRYNCEHPSKCLRSVFQLHNESLNIWIHLAGLVYFAVWLWRDFESASYYSNISFWDAFMFPCLLVASMMCMICSAIFHTFCCGPEGCRRVCLKIDLVGVISQVVGGSLALSYYGFKQYPKLQKFYVIESLVGAALMLPVPFADFIVGRKLPAGTVAAFFTAVGLSGLAPIVHWLQLPDVSLSVFSREGFMFPAYFLGGVAIFAFRFPERYFPNVFDIFLQSHQWWHLAVVAGSRSCAILALELREYYANV